MQRQMPILPRAGGFGTNFLVRNLAPKNRISLVARYIVKVLLKFKRELRGSGVASYNAEV